MNEKDREWVRQEINRGINRVTPDVDFYFDCPHCKHQTVAQEINLKDVSSYSWIPYYTVEFTKRDRLCLNCGRKFLYTEAKPYYVEKVKEVK